MSFILFRILSKDIYSFSEISFFISSFLFSAKGVIFSSTLNPFDDKDTSSENDDELESIKVEIGEDDIEFELATDYEISPDYNDINDLKEILDDILDDYETVKFKVNGENEVIELDLD